MYKGVSEYRMSYDLGHSRSYINNITSGKALPSMTEFIAICEYFGITPGEFFDEGNKIPCKNKEMFDDLKRLSKDDNDLISRIINRFIIQWLIINIDKERGMKKWQNLILLKHYLLLHLIKMR